MAKDFLSILRHIDSVTDAVWWACFIEATAPKPGNVHPRASFDDLTYQDFLQAGWIASTTLVQSGRSIGQRVLDTVVACVEQTGTNVNLGIALLLAPLVVAVQDLQVEVDGIVAGKIQIDQLHVQTSSVLDGIDAVDSRLAFEAISYSMAGGLDVPATDDPATDDRSTEMDVRSDNADHDDLVEAMRRAAHRDAIAAEYASGFAGVFGIVIDTLRSELATQGDLLTAVQHASIRLIAANGDTLIARKMGDEESRRVQAMAAAVDLDDPDSIDAFDRALRSNSNRLNPGSTADRIAAGLFVLLVCDFDSVQPSR